MLLGCDVPSPDSLGRGVPQRWANSRYCLVGARYLCQEALYSYAVLALAEAKAVLVLDRTVLAFENRVDGLYVDSILSSIVVTIGGGVDML
jgi:hypothetical protein